MTEFLDLTHTDLSRRIQANMIAYMKLFAGLPGAIIVDDEAFWIVTGDRAPGNMILRAAWDDDRAEAGINALLKQVGAHVEHMDWMVFPSDQPADLGKRLEARGMPAGRGGNWLWVDLTPLGAPPPVSADFRIERVRDDEAMAEWNRLSEAGFGGELSIFYEAYARHGYGADAFSLHYTGYLGDTPVTTGTVFDAGGTATIYDLSTPPEFRQQGFGGALTHALMREIRDRGYNESWLWASNMARPLYQSLGYVDADFGQREHEWRKQA